MSGAADFIYWEPPKGIVPNGLGICTLRVFHGEIFFYSVKCKRNCYFAPQRMKHFFMCHFLIRILCQSICFIQCLFYIVSFFNFFRTFF